MGLPTTICLSCALIILCCWIFGKFENKFYSAVIIVLILVNFIEFPYLFYVYGNSTIVYMVLGFLNMIIHVGKKNRLKCTVGLVSYDLIIILYSYTYNREAWQKFRVESIIGSTFCSLLIVLMTIYYVIYLWEQ